MQGGVVNKTDRCKFLTTQSGWFWRIQRRRMRNSNFNTKELVVSLHRRALVGWDDEIQGLHQQWSHSDVVDYDSRWLGWGANAENQQGKAEEGWLRTTQDYPDSVSQFPSVANSTGPTVWCSPWAPAHTPRNREGRSQCHSEVLCGHTEQRTRLRESKGLVSLEGQLWWVGKTQQRTSMARWRTGVRRCEYLHYPKSRRRGGHLNQPVGWELWLKEPTGTTPLRSNSPLCPQDKSHVQDVVVLRREGERTNEEGLALV